MRQTVLRKGSDIRRRILLGVVFLAPLFFLRNSFDVFNVPKLWLLMVALAIVVAIRIVELLQEPAASAASGWILMIVPGAAISGALIVGTIFSPYRVWGLVGDHSRFTGLVPYLVVILVGILIAETFRGDARPVAWALVASGAVAAVYAVVQVLGLDPFEWDFEQPATTTIGNTNFSGAFFAMCLPLGVGLFLIEPTRKTHAAVASGLIFVGWVAARSELAWAAGAAGLLVLFGTLMSTRWRPSRWIALAGAGIVAVAAVGFVMLAMRDDPPGFIPLTIERRAEWWQASVRMAGDSPVFGRGPNSFAIEHTRHRDIDDVKAVGFDVTDDPHSVPLSFATAAGIFGLVGWIAFAGWIVLMVARADPNERLGVAFGAAAIAYLVQSLLSIDVVTLRIAAWVVIGGMVAAFAPPAPAPARPYGAKKGKKKAKVKQAPEPLRGLPGVVVVILLTGVAVAWSTGFLSADISFRRGLALGAAGAPGAKENLESAVAFRDGNYTYRARYGTILGRNAVQEGVADDGDPQEARQLLAEAKDAFGFVGRIPHAPSVISYARVMRDWAQVEDSAEPEALALYEKAFELDPNNFLILEEQSEAAALFGRADLAAELASRAEVLRKSAGS